MLRSWALVVIALTVQVSPKPVTTPDPLDVRGKHLTIRPSIAVDAAAPGQRVTLRVSVTPDPKIHVYAQGQVDYIPIELTLDATADLKAWPAKYPVSRAMYFESLLQTLKVYDAPFRIAQDVTVAQTAALQKRAAAKEPLIVRGSLSYQACDDKVCFVPETVKVSWKLPLASISYPPRPRHPSSPTLLW